MKITVGRNSLFTELNFLQSVVERKTTIPVLTHLVIEAEGFGSRIKLKGTDLDVSLATTCDATIISEGAVCLNAKRLFEIVRSMPSGEITISVNDVQAAEITCGKSRFKVSGLPVENYPEVKTSTGILATIPAAALNIFHSRTAISVTAEESRYALNGVRFEITPTEARMIATDGHRLSFVSVQGSFGDDGLTEEVGYLIPKKGMAEVARLCADAPDAKVEFSATADHLFFKIGKRELVSRKLSGQFPNYRLVLPKDNQHKAIADAISLKQALSRVALMADSRTMSAKLEVDSGVFRISAQAQDVGEGVDELAVEYSGPAITAGFNIKYLSDFFSAIPDGRVSVEFKDDQSQVQMRSASESAYDFRYIVMPMRL